jgi:hypothetical protein
MMHGSYNIKRVDIELSVYQVKEGGTEEAITKKTSNIYAYVQYQNIHPSVQVSQPVAPKIIVVEEVCE